MSSAPLDTLNRPLRDLRISVTDRCNFRCSYCMPPESEGHRYRFIPRGEMLDAAQIARLANLFVQLGARKLRLTGGEPLLRSDIAAIVARLAALEGAPEIGLTTNGFLLPRYAAALREAGLSRVTVSLDTLDEANFRRTSGTDHSPQAVLDGIAAAQAAGLGDIKINAVVKRDTSKDEILTLAERFRHSGCTLRLIEYMDVGTLNKWSRGEVLDAAAMAALIGARHPIEPLQAAYRGEVARRYRYRDGGGEIGFITSVSQPFCGDCTRARLTVDGRLVTCLFSAVGVQLKPYLESPDDAPLRERIAAVWLARRDRYSELRAAAAGPPPQPKMEMYQLGG